MFVKKISGANDQENAVIELDFNGKVSKEDVLGFLEKVSRANFWKMDGIDFRDHDYYDGVMWTIEGVNNGIYQVAERLSRPGNDELFAVMAENLIEMAEKLGFIKLRLNKELLWKDQ